MLMGIKICVTCMLQEVLEALINREVFRPSWTIHTLIRRTRSSSSSSLSPPLIWPHSMPSVTPQLSATTNFYAEQAIAQVQDTQEKIRPLRNGYEPPMEHKLPPWLKLGKMISLRTQMTLTHSKNLRGPALYLIHLVHEKRKLLLIS